MDARYQLDITSYELTAPPGRAAGTPPHVCLDIKGGGGHQETHWLGAAGTPGAPGIRFVGSGALRVRAWSRALVLRVDLGVNTLYRHLEHGAGPVEGTLTFGRRASGVMLRVGYRVCRVRWRWQCVLREVRCVRVWHNWWGSEELVATPGSRVPVVLGTFTPLLSATPPPSAALELSVEAHTVRVACAVRATWARGWGRGHALGVLHLVPLEDGTLRVEASDVVLAEGASATVTVLVGDAYALTLDVAREDLAARAAAAAAPNGTLAPVAVPDASFGRVTHGNTVSMLVDGLETFERYYHALMGARHSVAVLAWELSLSFGLIRIDRAPLTERPGPRVVAPGAKWISLEDVLLARALAGVRVRIVVWRHQLLTYLNRFLYLGEVTIEAEVAKLVARGRALGVSVRTFHSSPAADVVAHYADPWAADDGIVVVIVGNPRGLLSSHHEKLLLVDAECRTHARAFLGGFDVARGRYDQPAHQIPVPYFELSQRPVTRRYTGPEVQPVFRQIRFLWHDVQVELTGPATQPLRLHFAQRWRHAFAGDVAVAEPVWRGALHHCPSEAPAPPRTLAVELVRCWRGVMDVQHLFDVHRQTLRRARHHLYIEHQYPFHNWALTNDLCDALRSNPSLRVLIVTAVKTDLPSGLVGDMVNWSQVRKRASRSERFRLFSLVCLFCFVLLWPQGSHHSAFAPH